MSGNGIAGMRHFIDFRNIDHGDSRRKFSAAHYVFAVRRDITAVWIFRNRNQIDDFLFCFLRIDHLHAFNHLEFSVLKGTLRCGDVDCAYRIFITTDHFFDRQPFFEIVHCRESPASIFAGIIDIAVAGHDYFEPGLQTDGIQKGHHGSISGNVVLGFWNFGSKFAITDNVLRIRRNDGDAVKCIDVWNLCDRNSFETGQIDSCDAIVRFVINPEKAAIVVAVGFGKDRMVSVTPKTTGSFQPFVRLRSGNICITVGGAGFEHGDGAQLTSAWKSVNQDVSALTSG